MKLKLWNEWKNRQLHIDHQLKVFHLPFTYLSFPFLLSASGGRSEWTTSIWLLWNECSYKRVSKESLYPFYHMRGQQEGITYEPGIIPSLDTQSASALLLYLQHAELYGKNFSCFGATQSSFVKEVQMD